MDYLIQQAKALLIGEGFEMSDNITYETSSNYPLVIHTNDIKGTMHFFLKDMHGILFYDGWSHDGCIMEVCDN